MSRLMFISVLFGSVFLARGKQEEQPPNDHRPRFPDLNDDPRLPDGKSQKDAIAKEQHERALKDADELIATAQSLKKEIEQAGIYVVPMASVKKTEEIERLAKRIRSRLKS